MKENTSKTINKMRLKIVQNVWYFSVSNNLFFLLFPEAHRSVARTAISAKMTNTELNHKTAQTRAH